MEVFVIYNKNTGFIDGGTGYIDKSMPPDGSTMAERIPEIIAKKPTREVVYLQSSELLNGEMPDSQKHKFLGGVMTYFSAADNVKEELKKTQEAKIQAKIRDMAIKDLKKDKDPLFDDYT